MDFSNLKLDTWWKIILVAGAAIIFISLTIKIDFLEEKHLLGFGVGLFLIGLSYFMSDKTANHFIPGGILSHKITKHNFVSILILLGGFGLLCFFGYKIGLQLI